MRRAGFGTEPGDEQTRVIWNGSDGLRLMAAERWAEARDAAAVWEVALRAMGFDHPATKHAYTVWVTCSYRLGDTAAVRSFIERISSLNPSQRTPLHEAQRLRFIALLGDCESPAVALASAADILRRRGLKFQLMLVQADAAEFLAASQPDAAAVALDEARELVAEMGAATIGRRLDELTPASRAAARA